MQKLATQGNASNIPGLSVPGASVAPVTTSTTYPTTTSTAATTGFTAGVTAPSAAPIGGFPTLNYEDRINAGGLV